MQRDRVHDLTAAAAADQVLVPPIIEIKYSARHYRYVQNKRTLAKRMYCQPRFDIEVVDQLEALVHDGRYKSVSKAIEELTIFGLKINTYKDMLEDPERAESLQKRIRSAMESDDVFAIARGLDSKRLVAVIEILQFEKELRQAKKEHRRPTLVSYIHKQQDGGVESVENLVSAGHPRHAPHADD